MDFPALYHSVILWIGDGTGAPDSLLHVHAGLAILFVARLVTRRSLATPIPFVIVAGAEAFNEIMDRLSFGNWRVEDTSFDILNTLFWLFVLMVGLRLRRAHAMLALAAEPTEQVGSGDAFGHGQSFGA